MYMRNDAEFYSNLGNETSEKLSPKNIDASSAKNKEIEQGPTSTIGQDHSNGDETTSWWSSYFSLCPMLWSSPKSPAQDVNIDKTREVSSHNATPSMERLGQTKKHEGVTGQTETGYFDDTRNPHHMSHFEETRV
eukprot:2211216-Ditylum_brightwellii.AAC.1